MLIRNLSSKITAIIFSSLAIIVLTGSVSAATPTLNPTRIALRCQIATNRINSLISLYDKNRDLHVQKYNTAKEALTTLVTRLQANGYDVTKLKADLSTWNGLILNFANQVKTLDTDLLTTKQFSCGTSEGQFADSIVAARGQLTIVREAGKSVLDYYRGTIKPDFQALKAQKPTKAPTPTI